MTDAIVDVLEHFGVKGMKWGKRKASSSQRTTFSTPPKKLSTEELARRISRMESEKKYNSLNRKDTSEGKKFVSDVLAGSGRIVAKTVLTGATLQVVKVAFDAKFGPGVGGAVTKRIK